MKVASKQGGQQVEPIRAGFMRRLMFCQARDRGSIPARLIDSSERPVVASANRDMMANCNHLWYIACMSVQITIRNVPTEVRDVLKSRAAAGGQSMQTYLLGELERIVGFPTNQELIRQIEERLEASDTSVSASEILDARDKDRK